MAQTSNYLAVDLGAESGRGMLGQFDGETLELKEIHRFANTPVRMLDTLYWNLPGLFTEVKNALHRTREVTGDLEAIGVDTWGVDFGLVSRDNALLGNPVHYRDGRTQGVMEAAFGRMSRERIYDETGLQFMPFNTLYQLLSLVQTDSRWLKLADVFLMMPDLFAWLLTGERIGEHTNASTTQLYDARSRKWSDAICGAMGIPRDILPPLVEPGTEVGLLYKPLREDVSLPRTTVVIPATHDTASAVAAVPVISSSTGQVPDWCYLSSGTWSLLGVEVPHPVINATTLQFNLTNEGGVGGTTRLLKNIMGLWLVQESRRTWAACGRDFSYEDLLHLAEESAPFRSLVDPDHSSFLMPGDMPERIRALCVKTHEAVPENEGAVVRCALESLALKYRWTIECLEKVIGGSIQTIHIVGGGCRNGLLCQFTANACGRVVHAGPSEATAVGNLLMQAVGQKRLGSLRDVRAVVARSFPVTIYEPRETAMWTDAAGRFAGLLQ